MVLPLFYSSGAVVYRKPAIEVAHHLHNLFYTLEGDGLSMKDVSEKLPEVLTPNESESIMSNK